MAIATLPQPAATMDRDRVTATLTTAFAGDPFIRWVLPSSATYVEAFPRLTDVVGGVAYEAGSADEVDDHAGAAIWVPPGTELDADAATDLLVEVTDEDRLPEVGAFLELIDRHHPHELHWYLPFVGVDPTAQGRGYGSLLLTRGLARADRDGLPAYLEASSPRNRALYERHGFRAIAEIRTPTSPPLWPMWREPGGGS